jgi:hypothetical protein
MKKYPSIAKFHLKLVENDCQYYIFDKLDGSNIRADWSEAQHFYKFGTKSQLFDKETPIFSKAIEIIKSKYEKTLTDVFNEKKFKHVTCFFEFFGKKTFAGKHVEDDIFDVVLIDISPYKKGILCPEEFISLTSNVEIPKLLYKGLITTDLIYRVKTNSLQGITFEGVVCKQYNKSHTSFLKIKTQDWVSKLHEFYDDDDELLEQLS